MKRAVWPLCHVEIRRGEGGDERGKEKRTRESEVNVLMSGKGDAATVTYSTFPSFKCMKDAHKHRKIRRNSFCVCSSAYKRRSWLHMRVVA